MVAYRHNGLYTFLLQTSIVLTISPNDVNEGNTTVMECVVEKDPPSPAGTFVWTMKGDITRMDSELISRQHISHSLQQVYPV